ncbi:MAG: MoxR family ATPase [Pseudomonadota bacterium]
MKERFEQIVRQVSRVVLGKEEEIRLALTCLFARGHLLIEDIPGIGKTTLAQALARVLGLEFRRIQCTSDLLPGDILGVSVFDQSGQSFVFHPGPIFTQVLLADEINRATPKTQSALLEAMEELQVTVEGQTRKLDRPFFVIGTQNPTEQSGTFPLPDSQLDRFLIRVSLGYPHKDSEKALLQTGDTKRMLPELEAVLGPAEVLDIQEKAAQVHASEALLEYILRLLEFTRTSAHFHVGLSPRAGLALLRAAQTWAFLNGRDYILPEDIQKVSLFVTGHRLKSGRIYVEIPPEELQALFLEVSIP